MTVEQDKKLRTAQIIQILIERDGDLCQFYDCPGPRDKFTDENFRSIDHVKPRSKGGTDTLDNYVMMHFKCNNKKGDREYLPDGTLEPLPTREPKSTVVKRDPCETCFEGRGLLKGEICDVCGSGPQPSTAPAYAQKTPKECSHSGEDHCWKCYLGFVERESALACIIKDAVEDLIKGN